MNRTDIKYKRIQKKDTIANNLYSPIVIVLESSHQDEHDPITLKALGPYIGATGYNLKTYFDSIIVHSQIYPHICSLKHDIVLLNAVQFQCSLGNSLSGKGSYRNKKCRDSNFIQGLRGNDLSRRIMAI